LSNIDLLVQMLNDGRVGELSADYIVRWLGNEDLVAKVRRTIEWRYCNLVRGHDIKNCPNVNTWRNEVSFSPYNLRKACGEIEMDLRILFARRNNLIGQDERTASPLPTSGKIAGITTFRLARAHIIHLSPGCIDCIQRSADRNGIPCDIDSINIKFAVFCGMFFIKKSYSAIPPEIRKEMIYTLTRRHTNQETLGIVFDTIKNLL